MSRHSYSSVVKSAYESAFVTGRYDLRELSLIRLPELSDDTPPPPMSTLRTWKSRYKWNQQRLAHKAAERQAEAAEVQAAITTAVPVVAESIQKQVEVEQSSNKRPRQSLAARLQAIAPQHIKEAVEASLADDLQLSNSRSLALYDVRMEQLVKRLGTTESAETWEQCQETAAEIRRAVVSGETQELIDAVKRLQDLTSKGNRDEQNWQEIRKWAHERAFIAKSEQERLRLGQTYLDIDQALAVATEKTLGIVSLIKQYGSPDLVARVRAYLSQAAA